MLKIPMEKGLFFVLKDFGVEIFFLSVSPISLSLLLQHDEMCFHCCTHNFMGAHPEDVVLIYGFVNFLVGGLLRVCFDSLVL